jgi:hypothetical protein
VGRPLAARLGYPAEVLERVPEGAIESFASSKHGVKSVSLLAVKL